MHSNENKNSQNDEKHNSENQVFIAVILFKFIAKMFAGVSVLLLVNKMDLLIAAADGTAYLGSIEYEFSQQLLFHSDTNVVKETFLVIFYTAVADGN
jgi:hypothetical protein